MSLNSETIVNRIDAITLIPESHRKEICPPPRSVKIELTAKCDLKCFFCATSHNLRPKGNMDFELLKKLLYDMRQVGVEEIGMFYLGESLLYPKLGEAINYAKQVCEYPYVFLTTNGRSATLELLEDIMSNGLDSLKFSFNFYSKEQYKLLTGVDGYEKVLSNIKLAHQIRNHVEANTGKHCGLYASSIKLDGDQQKLMEESIENIKPYVDEHYWLPLYGQAGYTAGAKGTKPVAGNIGRIGALRDSLPCWALFTEGHITWDGMLTGCCFSHESSWDFGDLTKMSFMEAWNSDAAQRLRRANLAKNVRGTACQKCIAYSS